jgi:hypothetical protein
LGDEEESFEWREDQSGRDELSKRRDRKSRERLKLTEKVNTKGMGKTTMLGFRCGVFVCDNIKWEFIGMREMGEEKSMAMRLVHRKKLNEPSV